MTASKIEWTGRSDWNPIRGCTRVSPGCGGPGPHGGCYAEAIAARFSDPGQAFHGFATRTAAGPRWTGQVEVQWDRLTLPLSWRKPALIFASSTSDFFHEALPMHEVAQLFGVMIAAHHLRGHIFQVLTKRPERMSLWLNDPEFWDIANAEAGMHIMARVDPLDRRSDDARATCEDYGPVDPPPGIWLGTSVEDQQRADERVGWLIETPAMLRFLSVEPMLGPIDLTHCADAANPGHTVSALTGWGGFNGPRPGPQSRLPKVHWVIVGGESGPRARAVHPTWVRAIREQCREAQVPFLFKQWGEWSPRAWKADAGTHAMHYLRASSFQKINHHPDSIERTSAGPEWQAFAKVGKKAAGRLLDGVQHDGMPA